MEHIKITGLPFDASRIGLGTWAIGGWLWGGTEESDAISTIHAALDNGINLIDTAPVYGFGRSEELVGKARNSGNRGFASISRPSSGSTASPASATARRCLRLPSAGCSTAARSWHCGAPAGRISSPRSPT